MSTSFVCRSAIAFPYWTNDYFCVSFWETRLRFPHWKMTILVIFQFEKKLRIRKKFPGNREIGKSGNRRILKFRIFPYIIIIGNFGFAIPPPLIFPRNPAFPGFGSGKNFPGNREIGKSGNRRILKFLIFPYIVIIGNFGFAIPPL